MEQSESRTSSCGRLKTDETRYLEADGIRRCFHEAEKRALRSRSDRYPLMSQGLRVPKLRQLPARPRRVTQHAPKYGRMQQLSVRSMPS